MTITEKSRFKHAPRGNKSMKDLLKENARVQREYKYFVKEKLKTLIHNNNKNGIIEPAYEIYNKDNIERKKNRKSSFGTNQVQNNTKQEEQEEKITKEEEYKELDLHEEDQQEMEEAVVPSTSNKKQRKIDSILFATKELLSKRIDFKLSASRTVNKNNNTSMDVFEIFKNEPVDIKALNQEETIFEIQYQQKPLTPKKTKQQEQPSTTSPSQPSPSLQSPQQHVHIDEDRTLLESPAFSLYEISSVMKNLHWKQKQMVGNGLNNLGNTCFMNAALQCLAYTPPLVYFLMEHMPTATTTTSTPSKQFNALETLARTVSKIQSPLFSSATKGSYSPQEIAKHLKSVGRFRLGRQEDSHEFFIQLLDKLEQSILKPLQNKNLDKKILRTNFVNQAFGGILRSQIRSLQTNYISNTYDPFIDIGINCCRTIEEGLNQFIAPEKLDGKNKYKDPIRKQYVNAVKQMTIFRLPPVLVIHLKRFDYLGRKIKKHVQFSCTLDMTPYLSDTTNIPKQEYELYAILVHDGGSCNSGHYYSFVKNSNDCWYCMDDSLVSQVSVKRVLEQNPYMLFYVLKNVPTMATTTVVPMNGKIVSPSTTKKSTTSLKVVKTVENVSLPMDKESKPIKNMTKHIENYMLNQYEDDAMDAWELEESQKAKEKQKSILKRETLQHVQEKSTDDWDKLLDMGKSKKRKMGLDTFDMLPEENVFQKMSNKKQRRV